MARGDHIYVLTFSGSIPFQHHGIDMGDGTVVHLAPASGSRVTLRDDSGDFCVRREAYDVFCRGQEPKRVMHDDAREPETIAKAAEQAVGETGYSLFDSNCEHFATRCATGRLESHQIEMGEATVSAFASMATKTFWAVSSRVGSHAILKGAVLKGAMRVHPAALLADGVEMAALAAGCQSGLTAKRSRRLAKFSGTVAAAGIGGIVGGPAGAVACMATHSSSSAIADRLCKSVRKWLS